MASRGVLNYVQDVLVPELAVLLVKDDLKLSRIHQDGNRNGVGDGDGDRDEGKGVDRSIDEDEDHDRVGGKDIEKDHDKKAREVLEGSIWLGELLHPAIES